MQSERYEYKYLIDEATALKLRAFLSGRLPLDEAGVGQPGLSYRVNSIYLDSDKLYTFWDWVNSNRNRFKLRMRFYDPMPDTPVFLEIKRRVCGCILKQRCGVAKAAMPAVLAGQVPAPHLLISREPKHQVALETFVIMASLLEARPKAMVTYRREAYVPSDNESVRVTFDREVRIALCPTADFNLELRPHVQPFGNRVILELKFTNFFPTWLTEMVEQFNLTRSAAAKYCEGIASLLHPEHANWPAQPVDAPLVEKEGLCL
jgi:hypothetical protein